VKSSKLLLGIECKKVSGKLFDLCDFLDNHPRFKVSLHFNGFVYDELKADNPEFLDLIKKLVRRGQVEILCGAHYDAVLALLPDEDKIGQIEMANDFIKKQFNFLPTGLYLAHDVWQDDLPKYTSHCGVEYALVNKACFVGAEALDGYYVTEEQGHLLKVFPVDPQIGNSAAVLVELDDVDLKKLASLGETLNFSAYLEDNAPLGRIYLSAQDNEAKNDLIKYPEANQLHKKMLLVSQKLATLKKGKALIGNKEKDSRLKKAAKFLYKGQKYDPDINSQEAYSNLIQAEVEIEKYTRGSRAFVDLSVMDFDKDGKDEVLLSNDLLNLYFSPSCGGSLFELDYKPKARNILAGACLQDLFFTPDSGLDTQQEVGDFVQAVYAFMPRRVGREAGVLFSRDGMADNVPVKIEKLVTLCAGQSIIQIEYALANLSRQAAEFWLGVDFNLNLACQDKQELFKVAAYKIVDAEHKFEVLLQMEKPGLLWVQEQQIMPTWIIKLGPKDVWKNKLTIRIEE